MQFVLCGGERIAPEIGVSAAYREAGADQWARRRAFVERPAGDGEAPLVAGDLIASKQGDRRIERGAIEFRRDVQKRFEPPVGETR